MATMKRNLAQNEEKYVRTETRLTSLQKCFLALGGGGSSSSQPTMLDAYSAERCPRVHPLQMHRHHSEAGVANDDALNYLCSCRKVLVYCRVGGLS